VRADLALAEKDSELGDGDDASELAGTSGPGGRTRVDDIGKDCRSSS
jgi:hypothetical protein